MEKLFGDLVEIDVHLIQAKVFDYIWEAKNVDSSCRLKFLAKYLSDYTPARLEILAKNTENFSYGDLRELSYRLMTADGDPRGDESIIKSLRESFGIEKGEIEKAKTEE